MSPGPVPKAELLYPRPAESERAALLPGGGAHHPASSAELGSAELLLEFHSVAMIKPLAR